MHTGQVRQLTCQIKYCTLFIIINFIWFHNLVRVCLTLSSDPLKFYALRLSNPKLWKLAPSTSSPFFSILLTCSLKHHFEIKRKAESKVWNMGS